MKHIGATAETHTVLAHLRRPDGDDEWSRVTTVRDAPPAAIRTRARFLSRSVWELFILDEDEEWPLTVVYRLVDRMDDDGNPVGPMP